MRFRVDDHSHGWGSAAALRLESQLGEVARLADVPFKLPTCYYCIVTEYDAGDLRFGRAFIQQGTRIQRSPYM